MSDFKTLLFSPKGRINRKPFFWTPILLGVSESLIIYLLQILNEEVAAILMPILVLLSTFICVMVYIKRWHDLDKSGWMTLTMLIPIANAFIGFYLLFAKGTEGSNTYGEDPLA